MARYLITGATGFVGGHLAEACKQRGHEVTALARPSSDITWLQHLGVKIAPGDITDLDAVGRALGDAEVVVNAAAKVGDWGPVEDYRKVNVEALHGMLELCRTQKLKRFVHVSSLGVYAARHHYGTDESVALPARHMDGYTQTKVESEQLALCFHKEHGIPVTVVRPGFIYGPRDRTVLPKLMDALAANEVPYLGGGKKALNATYVGNLVHSILLAAENPRAVGQVYNITDGELVTKKQFIDAVADGAGLPRPSRNIPLFVARLAAWAMERRARRKGAKVAPRLTQAKLKFLGLNLGYSIEKAKTELGYQPVKPFSVAMAETMAWYRENR